MVKAIELATGFEIQVVERPVYIINGAKRAYLSERAALNKLSSILTEREFREKVLKQTMKMNILPLKTVLSLTNEVSQLSISWSVKKLNMLS